MKKPASLLPAFERPALPVLRRPLSLAREAQLLTWVASPAGEAHFPPLYHAPGFAQGSVYRPGETS